MGMACGLLFEGLLFPAFIDNKDVVSLDSDGREDIEGTQTHSHVLAKKDTPMNK